MLGIGFILQKTQEPGANVKHKPFIISLQQDTLISQNGKRVFNYPAYVAERYSYIDTLPFDGIAIHSHNGLTLMDGAEHSYSNISEEWKPMQTFKFKNVIHNFAVINVDSPNDFFDDWSPTLMSFKNFAKVINENNIEGIVFDNEEYQKSLWAYPSSVKYRNKTLEEYESQAKLRGKQIMESLVSEFPNIRVIILNSPSNTPLGILSIPFTQGLTDASKLPVIDGGEEAYGFKSENDFQESYERRKTFMQQKTSISFGIYNGGSPPLPGFNTSPTSLQNKLTLTLHHADEYVWLYWEGGNWYEEGGVDKRYVETIRNTKMQKN